MTSAADIVIVGGGPAGLSTWLHLHALSPDLASRTVLLEKEHYPRNKLCGGGLTAVGDLILQGLGLALDCEAAAIGRVDVRFGDFVHSVERSGALRVVRRLDFDQALARAAVERGLDLREGVSVASLEHRENGLIVHTSAGQLSAILVVAADGAQSVVRRGLGLGDDSRLARLIEVEQPLDLDAHPSWADTAIFDFTPMAQGVQGYVWHFPYLANGQIRGNHGIYDSRLHRERERADLAGVFGRALTEAGIPCPPDEYRSHPIRWFGPPGTLFAPRVLLVGDAAGVDPLFGEGIAPSLDYGDLAARLLVDAFAREDWIFRDSIKLASGHALIRSLVSRGALANVVYAQRTLTPEVGAALVGALLSPA